MLKFLAVLRLLTSEHLQKYSRELRRKVNRDGSRSVWPGRKVNVDGSRSIWPGRKVNGDGRKVNGDGRKVNVSGRKVNVDGSRSIWPGRKASGVFSLLRSSLGRNKQDVRSQRKLMAATSRISEPPAYCAHVFF
jgi:hypothetical protein